jgi:hypothetical protein
MTRSPDSLVPSDSGQPEPEKRDDKASTCWQGGAATSQSPQLGAFAYLAVARSFRNPIRNPLARYFPFALAFRRCRCLAVILWIVHFPRRPHGMPQYRQSPRHPYHRSLFRALPPPGFPSSPIPTPSSALMGSLPLPWGDRPSHTISVKCACRAAHVRKQAVRSECPAYSFATARPCHVPGTFHPLARRPESRLNWGCI